MSAIQIRAQLDEAQAELARHETALQHVDAGSKTDVYTKTRIEVLRTRIRNLELRLRIRKAVA